MRIVNLCPVSVLVDLTSSLGLKLTLYEAPTNAYRAQMCTDVHTCAPEHTPHHVTAEIRLEGFLAMKNFYV
jgi:hypothetical protein